MPPHPEQAPGSSNLKPPPPPHFSRFQIALQLVLNTFQPGEGDALQHAQALHGVVDRGAYQNFESVLTATPFP